MARKCVKSRRRVGRPKKSARPLCKSAKKQKVRRSKQSKKSKRMSKRK